MSLKVFVVPVLLALFSQVISQNVIYISPSAESPCPVSACFTLAECAQNVTMCFVSNTTLKLLQGTHTLETMVMVSDVTNLVLIGDSSSLPEVTTEIRFIGVARLLFKLISDVQICAISFFNSTIFIREARVIRISDCIFQQSTHTALDVLNATAYFERVCFTNNHEGGMVASGSILSFSGGNVFANNSASLIGGGLTVKNCDVDFTGWTSFTNNSAAIIGGGMYSEYSSLNFNGIMNFTHNTARNFGGGFIAAESIVIFTSITTFSYNSAENGGGIYSANSRLTFKGIANFTLNKAIGFGGAFFAVLKSWVVFSSKTSFFRNSAENGGGFACQSVNVNFTGINKFINNSAMVSGGGIHANDSRLVFSGKNEFTQNKALMFGGAIFSSNKVTANFHGNNILSNNSAGNIGGGFAILNSTVTLVGITSLTNNSAGVYGGGLWAQDGNVNCFGNSTFTGNSAVYGGAIGVGKSVLSLSGNISFTINLALGLGGGLYMQNSSGLFSGYNAYIRNSAWEKGGGVAILGSILEFNGIYNLTNNLVLKEGGGIYAQESNVLFTGEGFFIHNLVGYNGGGFMAANTIAIFKGSNSFRNNSAGNGAGVITIKNSSLEFCGNTSFMDNSAASNGGGIYAEESHSVFRGSSRFSRNLAIGGGGAYSIGSLFTFIGSSSFEKNFAKFYGGAMFSIFQPFGTVRSAVEFNGTVRFVENQAGNGGGALALWNYTAVFIGRCTFRHNVAKSGGALIGSTPNCYFFPNTFVNFENNYAVQRGGAINHLDDPFSNCFLRSRGYEETELLIPCFFRIPQKSESSIKLVFTNNTAGEAGDSLYGGAIDSCLTYSINGTQLGYDMFDLLATITGNSTTLSVSSDPLRVCLCNNNQPDCNTLSIKRETYPGATFLISVVGVGQRNGTVPAVIRAELGMKNQAKINDLQKAQEIKQHCSTLRYTIHSSAAMEKVYLYVEGSCQRLGDPLMINVTLNECPKGFVMSESKNACICEERLLEYTSSCNITDATIERSGNFWVGYSNSSSGLILHPHCPFDYCTTETIRFTLEDSDKQCRYNRTRLLCGACKPGLSIALATSECLACSNSRLSLLLAFALAGVVLVVFLFVCKLTVSVGTLNGLILYTNIVAVNHSTFFPNGDTNILTVFVAWMNLDIGIKTCLYDGMDAYARTWLQFVFPLYTWALVGLIIIASYYSTKIARILTGTNPVSVLATLFLLSYAKLLRTIIAVLSFTSIEYPNNSGVTVWLSDGNIEYFHGKHIPLAIVALIMFLLLLLPFTLLLTFGQWIQANSNRRMLSWASDPRVTAVLDAYHAPFNRDTRYWIGLLLLLRCALFLVFACNVLGDPSLNLLVISTSVVGLEAAMKFTGDIFKNRYLDILESSFILNLGILAIGTYQVEQGGGSQTALYCTSVGVAFATFIGITLYHVILQLKGSRIWNALQYYFKCERRWVAIPTEETTEERVHNPGAAPTVSFINLREPLELINSCSN